MKSIWKYTLGNDVIERVWLPTGAVVRSVGMQGGKLRIWAEVDEHATKEERKFLIQATGRELIEVEPHEERRFLGAVIREDAGEVWHIFEVQRGRGCPKCGCPFYRREEQHTPDPGKTWRDEDGQWYGGPAQRAVITTCSNCGNKDERYFEYGKPTTLKKLRGHERRPEEED